tara:strand:+ start:2968 stop:4902 length:1935 start_codon:yes stop_codon:yes gene_type:complete
MRVINQLQRSALRRALQQIFIDGTLVIYSKLGTSISDEEKFNISWKSMLCLVGIRTSIDIDNLTMEEIIRLMKQKEIIPSSRKSHQHHSLVNECITILNKKSMKLGVESVSSLMLLKALKKERIEHFSNPWNHVLPEDIGSCYEVMMECKIEESEGVYNFIQRKDRRNSGIHHTPFDLAEHMCELAITKSNYDKFETSEFLAVDIAHGAGAFTLQMARKISRIKNIDIQRVLTENILGFDIDSEVLEVASFCFHIEANFPKKPLSYNLFRLNSLEGDKSRKNIHDKIAKMVDINSAKIVVIGNPPYVEIKLEEYQEYGFETLKCRNLSAFFLEQALSILPINSVISQVVPISLIHSKRMISIRELIIKISKSVHVESFDCVPGYMFDQGKIGSNSNTAITQRISVITLVVGEKLNYFSSSRFLRWRGDERNTLFESIRNVRLNKELYSPDCWPCIGSKEEKNILNKIMKNPKKVKHLISKDLQHRLFIPDSTRYFISAVHQDLERGQKVICLPNQESSDLVQILLNSDFFYWFWRITDGGFSVSLNTISSLPLPPDRIIENKQSDITKIARKLRSRRIMDSCRVVKSNKGDKINYKFDKDKNLMTEIDNLVHELYEIEIKYSFHAHKSNSIQRFEAKLSSGLRI